MDIRRDTWSTIETRWSFIGITMPLCARYSPPLCKESRKIGSTPCRHGPFGVSMIFLWFSPKNIRHAARSRRSLIICSTWRRTQRSRSTTTWRFKAEKAKIVGCDDLIASVAFQKGFLEDNPLLGELIMKEDLTLADSFVLVEKHAFWDEARRAERKQAGGQIICISRANHGSSS